MRKSRKSADGAARCVTDADMRDWLRIPEGVDLPGWARARLGEELGAELARREGRPVEQAVFGIVDLETTGLSAAADRILEIGVVVQRGGDVLCRFASFVEAEVPLPSWIADLTGIDEAELVNAPSLAQVLADLSRLLEERAVEVLVAHNASFDRGFLERAWREVSAPRPLPPFLCSMRLARKWISSPSHGLDALVEQLAIPRRARHRALGDAEMTADLWRELLARGRVRGVHTLQALREVAEVGRAPKRRSVRVVDVESGIG